MLPEPSDLDALVTVIMADYEDNARFFADHRLPEYVVLEELSLTDAEVARFLTFSCVTNHIHDGSGESKRTDGPNGLWQICGNLWEQHQWAFAPAELVGDDRKDELESLFSSIEIMDHRDPDWWFRTADTLLEHWDGDPETLLTRPNPSAPKQGRFDAPTLVRMLNTYDFPALSGRKIRPLWLRLMHEEVQELSRIEEIAIPIDFHIVGISNRLSRDGTEFDRFDSDDKNTLRAFWQLVCHRNDVVPVELDKPLWLLHKYWADGGEAYVKNRLRSV